jgi:hypothetical protein
MKIASGILLIALLATAWRQPLCQELNHKSVQENFTLQAQCAEMAHKFISSKGWKPDENNYTNHFNLKLSKCFVLVTYHKFNGDFSAIDLYDALEGKHYAMYNGHDDCDVAITKEPNKCVFDSGRIWLDGDDSKSPADFIVGFRGTRFGGGAGDETTQKIFLNHIRPFMNE